MKVATAKLYSIVQKAGVRIGPCFINRGRFTDDSIKVGEGKKAPPLDGDLGGVGQAGGH